MSCLTQENRFQVTMNFCIKLTLVNVVLCGENSLNISVCIQVCGDKEIINLISAINL